MTITVETATVYRVRFPRGGTRRFFTKYAALKAYCTRRILDREWLHGDYYDDDEIWVEMSKKDSHLAVLRQRYYRFCLAATRGQ